MTTYDIRCALEQSDVAEGERRHVEGDSGAPICEAEAEGAFVVDDPTDANCPACRLIVLGPGGLN